MAKTRSLRDLLRKKRTENEKKAFSPAMRDLMGSFVAQHGPTQDSGRPSEQEPARR